MVAACVGDLCETALGAEVGLALGVGHLGEAGQGGGGREVRGGMVKLKVVISFKRLQVIFIHSYGSSIAPKMTF